MAAERRRATIYDVAQAAGVSKSLVSLVLRGSPSVSEPRRAAVLAAIEQLNYRPSQAAAALAGGTSQTVGVVIDDYTNVWFVELLRGLQEGLGNAGLRIAVSDRTLNAHVESDPLDGFLSTRVEALVLATEPTPAMRFPSQIPVIVAGNRATQVTGADISASDDRFGARRAIEYLISLGHRHIGHIGGGGGASMLRRNGYQDAMSAADLDERIVILTPHTTEDSGYQCTNQLLRETPEITAILAGNDSMAMGALTAARENGLSVPEDLSIIGYDNSPLSGTHLLRLTTVDSRNRELGMHVAEQVLSRLADPERAAQKVSLEPALVERGTCAPVRPA
ncbi:LacI family DNA-binding transcriptional regulator [Glutamicibacter sp. AOP12-B1-11]|uniref:LacI family DNA-binding transcriptional regulator n=1 Tax=Glutamicibacter sp. AOP12-B1-11 TaxID=3457725 RepID=UPI0040334A04